MIFSKRFRRGVLDWIIIVIITVVGVVGFPVFDNAINTIYLQFASLGPKSIWIVIGFSDTLPKLLLGALLGAGTAGVLRRRSVLLSIFPSILVSGFDITYSHITPASYASVANSSWVTALFSWGWIASVFVSYLSARLVLHLRKGSAEELSLTRQP